MGAGLLPWAGERGRERGGGKQIRTSLLSVRMLGCDDDDDDDDGRLLLTLSAGS